MVFIALVGLEACVTTNVILPKAGPVDIGIRSVEIEESNIRPRTGVFIQYQSPWFRRAESQISGLAANHRTRNKQPVIFLDAEDASIERAQLVKLELEPKDSTRHVKFALYTGNIDKDWVIPVTRTKASDGRWQFTPSANMEPGEYAVWHPLGRTNPFERTDSVKGDSFSEKRALGQVRIYEQSLYRTGVFYSFGIDK